MARLEFAQAGAGGRPFMLVHGFTGAKDDFTEWLERLAARHEVSLPRISVDDMNGDLTLAQRLLPIAQALANVSRTVTDTILQAQSECWWAATAFYSALARLSDADPQLEGALKPVVDFFARRRRTDAPASS